MKGRYDLKEEQQFHIYGVAGLTLIELKRCYEKYVNRGTDEEINKAISAFIKNNKGLFEWIKITVLDGGTLEERISEMKAIPKSRVYVTVGGNDLLSITYFGTDNKRVKVINLSHTHKGMREHVHHGYLHYENDGSKGATNLNDKEKAMVDLVKK